PAICSGRGKMPSRRGGLFAPMAVAAKTSRPAESVTETASPATALAPETQAKVCTLISAAAARMSPAPAVSMMRGFPLVLFCHRDAPSLLSAPAAWRTTDAPRASSALPRREGAHALDGDGTHERADAVRRRL